MSTFQTYTSLFINACWIIFLLYWFLNAFTNKRTVWRQNIWRRIGTALLFFITCAVLSKTGNPIVQSARHGLWIYSPLFGIVTDIIAGIGLFILIWSRRTLGRNWSGRVVLKENHELVTTGPYATIRHPIYIGALLLALATVCSYASFAGCIVFVLFCIIFISRTFQEEKLMLQQFPDQYPPYKARTYRLLPYIW